MNSGQCVNCRIHLQQNILQVRRIEMLSNPRRSILVNWISPEQVSRCFFL